MWKVPFTAPLPRKYTRTPTVNGLFFFNFFTFFCFTGEYAEKLLLHARGYYVNDYVASMPQKSWTLTLNQNLNHGNRERLRGKHSSNVIYIVAFDKKHTRALTFENLCQRLFPSHPPTPPTNSPANSHLARERARVGLPAKGPVLVNLNNLYKVSPQVCTLLFFFYS